MQALGKVKAIRFQRNISKFLSVAVSDCHNRFLYMIEVSRPFFAKFTKTVV